MRNTLTAIAAIASAATFAQQPELRWEYAWSFDNAQYTLASATILKSKVSQDGKLGWFIGAGPAIGTRVGDDVPVVGPFASLYGRYATEGFEVYAGLSGYGFITQKGPTIGRAAFVVGVGYRF